MKFKKLVLPLALSIMTFSGYSQNAELAKKESDTKVETAEIPIDPNVKIGKLSNGLTYYIRNNGKPEDKVELRLVVN
ncbi:MAG: hypothetical protein R2816_03490, partial [Flavobacteriaceae bacterium]